MSAPAHDPGPLERGVTLRPVVGSTSGYHRRWGYHQRSGTLYALVGHDDTSTVLLAHFPISAAQAELIARSVAQGLAIAALGRLDGVEGTALPRTCWHCPFHALTADAVSWCTQHDEALWSEDAQDCGSYLNP